MSALRKCTGAPAQALAALFWLSCAASSATAPRVQAPAPEVSAKDSPASADTSLASPAPPPQTPGQTAEGSPPSSASATDRDDGLDADIAELSRNTAASGTPGDTGGSEVSGREVVYRVTPTGLVIELDGIHFRPEAKPFKAKNGAYGIELSVSAESFDGRKYWVDKPSAGPLSLAGKIEDKAGKALRFSDQRKPAGEEGVTAGEPYRFRQRWPATGQPKLWPGQKLTLEVGLWGVRAEAGRQRPVRRFFVVEMTAAGNRPRAVVSPPTMDWGN
jgi:hypothetical protein